MERPLTIFCTPLPAGSIIELEGWRRALEAALEPWLDDRQLAHVRRFGRSPNGQAETPEAQQDVLRAALSRLLARAQLVTHAAQQAKTQFSTATGPLPHLGMDTQGCPLLPGWHAAFSHSGEAAFCALCLGQQMQSWPLMPCPRTRWMPNRCFPCRLPPMPLPRQNCPGASPVIHSRASTAKPCAAGQSRRRCSRHPVWGWAWILPGFPQAVSGKEPGSGTGRWAYFTGAVCPAPATG